MPLILALMFRGIRDIVLDVERPQRLERRTRHIARPGVLIPRQAVDRLLEAERRIAERVGRLWDDHDVLLMPMLSEPAVPAQLMEGRGATVTYLWESGWVPFGVLWNSTGQPAASVPAGFDAQGPAAGRPARRAPARRGHASGARGPDRGRSAVGTSPPARLRLLACAAAWRAAVSAQASWS